jgi:hypothetical protein
MSGSQSSGEYKYEVRKLCTDAQSSPGLVIFYEVADQGPERTTQVDPALHVISISRDALEGCQHNHLH